MNGWYGWYVGVGSLNLTQDRNHAHEITTWDFLRSEDPPESDGTDGPDLEPAHEEAKAQWTLGLAGLEGQDCSSATPKDWISQSQIDRPKKAGTWTKFEAPAHGLTQDQLKLETQPIQLSSWFWSKTEDIKVRLWSGNISGTRNV